MNERAQVYAATVAGSVLGALVGYLFFTESGRALRRKVEPSLEDFAREILNFKGAVARARGIAHEGWRLMDELAAESSHQTKPF